MGEWEDEEVRDCGNCFVEAQSGGRGDEGVRES